MFVKYINLIIIAITLLSCMSRNTATQYNATIRQTNELLSSNEFEPTHPSTTYNWPLHFSLDWGDLYDRNLIFYDGISGRGTNIFADTPIYWKSDQDCLVVTYGNLDYRFPPKDFNGYPPRLSPDCFAYTGYDESSIISYYLDTKEIETYHIQGKISNLLGYNPYFAFSSIENNSTLHDTISLNNDLLYNLYIFVPGQAPVLLDLINTKLPILSANCFIKDNCLYFISNRTLYMCSDTGVTKLLNLENFIPMEDELNHLQIIDVFGSGNTIVLLQYWQDYYIINITNGSGYILDEFHDYIQWNAQPKFAIYDNGLITCVDGKILYRNINTHNFETLAELPDTIDTYSSIEPYSQLPDNLAIHIMDGGDGDIVLITSKGYIIYSRKTEQFTQYNVIDAQEELINYVAINNTRLILGTNNYGYYIIG